MISIPAKYHTNQIKPQHSKIEMEILWDLQADVGKKNYPNNIRCTEHPSSCGRSGSFQAESLGVTLNSSQSMPVVKHQAWCIQKLTSCPVAQIVFFSCQQHSERIWQSRENKLCISSTGERVCTEWQREEENKPQR